MVAICVLHNARATGAPLNARATSLRTGAHPLMMPTPNAAPIYDGEYAAELRETATAMVKAAGLELSALSGVTWVLAAQPKPRPLSRCRCLACARVSLTCPARIGAPQTKAGKGLLACDESTGTIGTRLEARRHPATNRRRLHPSSPFAASLACWRRRR